MAIHQANLPKNKSLAFIQLSAPNQLHDDCWAEENQRVLIVGIRKGEQQELRRVLSHYAEKQSYVEEGCFGTSVSCRLKAIIPSSAEKLRGFLQALEDRGLINEQERTRIGHDLGLRRHQAYVEMEIGAGI
jgi:hypothetical protein